MCWLLLPGVSWAAPARPFPDIATGRALILEKGCTNCHGILGPGGRQGPDLVRTARGKSAAELLSDMWNHIPQMAGALVAGERLPSLSGDELRDLVGYLSFVNYLGDPGDADRGGAALARMPCLSCHDLQEAGSVGPALVDARRSASPVGLVTDLWNHYPRMREALRQRGERWFTWNGDLVTDLSRYLVTLVPAHNRPPLLTPGDPEKGSGVFGRLGCRSCHNPSRPAAWAEFLRLSNARSAAGNGAMLLGHLPTLGGRAALRPISEEDMADLLAYLSLAGAQLPGGDAQKGRRVFERKRCVACHALPGKQPGIGPDVENMPLVQDPYTVAALMLRHARNMTIAVKLEHLPWPQMQSGELLDLYAFLASQQHP
jgi:cytochrome c2